MLIPSTTKILIVPDFGVDAESEARVSLKDAIETRYGGYSVMIADLQRMVLDENPGKELKDSQIIELSARLLESLANDKNLKWDDYVDDIDRCAPGAVVVFGKSAMLAGGVKDKDILFINPEYDSEWPWKKQYYADRDSTCDYMAEFHNEIKKPIDIHLLSGGMEIRRSHKPPMRFVLATELDDISEFCDRYPNLGVKVKELDLAKEICEFADGVMEFPMLEIYEMIRNANWQSEWMDICTFSEPVKIGRVTVAGLSRGIPYTNGQSGIKVRTVECSTPLPIEMFGTRHELALLKKAVSKAIEALPPKKRILIVPDYFIPYDAPNVVQLRDCLREMGYYVVVFAAGDTLERSRTGIERRCKNKPYDLIVTLETGCLLAVRITNAPRIFVNPDWDAWKWMKERLGDKNEMSESRGTDNSGPFYTYRLNLGEIIGAQKMGERSYIRRNGEPAVGWFTHDMMDSDQPEEHMKRFNSAGFPPVMDLATNLGIQSLAVEIDKYFNNYDKV